MLMSCIENRSCAVVDVERAVQLIGSLRGLCLLQILSMGDKIISSVLMQETKVFGKGSSTVHVCSSHEAWIPTKKMARSTLWPKPLGWHIPNSCSSTSRLPPLSGSTTRNPLYLEAFSQPLKNPTWAKHAAFQLPGRPQAKLLMSFLYKPRACI